MLDATRVRIGRWLAGMTAMLLVLGTAMVGTAPPAHADIVYTTIDQVEYLANDANVSAGASAYRYHAARPWTAPSPTLLSTVTIDDTVYTVTGISGNAFNCNLTDVNLCGSVGDVTIPDTVTTIGGNAFRRALATSLHLGNSVQTIGSNAFTNNNLGAVTIPDSVTSLVTAAFVDAGITSLHLGNGVQTIGQFAFSTFEPNGGALNDLGAVTIPNSVTSIGNSAFLSAGVTDLVLGAGVTSIGTSAFDGNPALTEIVLTGPAPTTFTDAGATGSFGAAAGKTLYYLPQHGAAAVPGGYTTPTWRGYATFPLQQVTVTFDANGHGTAPAPQTVTEGTTATAPTAPTAAGWAFTGWYTDAATTSLYDFTTPVTADLTLYAGWAQQLQVTFDANGHGTAPAPATVIDGQQATAPTAPTAVGWVFTGWHTDAAATSLYDFTAPVTSDLTLYAGWEVAQYQVTYDANGHGTAPASETVTHEGVATVPVAPSEPGWSFTGWYLDAAATSPYDFTEPVTGDLTLYAGWLEQLHVTFEANGHGSAPTAQIVLDGELATAPTAPTDAGWAFTGWYTDAAATNLYDFTTPVTGDLTLYAGWLQELQVTFDANGHGIAPATQTVIDGAVAADPGALSAVGWVFTGWYTDAAATSVYDFAAPVTSDLTLYAGWVIAQYEVTFDANGHGTAPAPESVTHGSTATVPVAPSAAGWTFTGWYTDAAATSLYDFVTPITGDLTLYAGWLQEFQVTFDANGHGTAPAAQTVTDGTAAAAPVAPSEPGWSFTGWYADEATADLYDFTDPVTGDLTLYAGWLQELEVTFDANGHSTAPAAQTVTDGNAATVPDAPTAAGWTFTGWYTDADAASVYDFATPVTGDLTLYAGWELTLVPPSIHGPATLAATVGVPVDYTPTVGGVVAPNVTLTSGTLPAGLNVDGTTGAITGIPKDAAGTYVVTITAANGVGSPAALQVTITLDAGQTTSLVAITPSVQHVEQGDTVTITATGTDSAGNSFVIPAAEMVYRSSVATDVVDGNRITFPSASPHVITGTHLPTGLVLTTTIEVTPATAVVVGPPPPAPTTTVGSLPTTGANPVLLAAIAFLLLVAGCSAMASTVPSTARRNEPAPSES